MPLPHPLPVAGSVFLDARGDDRALRVSWHHESDLVVLSLWRDNVCTGSFRLPVGEVESMIALLRSALDQAYAAGHPAAAPQTGAGASVSSAS